MKVNSIKTISKTIYLLDKHIEKILQENEIDESILSTLTSVRFDYITELNNLIRTKNTREMFDRKK